MAFSEAELSKKLQSMSINEDCREEKQRSLGGKARMEEANDDKNRDCVKGRIVSNNGNKKENCSRGEGGGRSKFRCLKCGGKSPAHGDKRSLSPSLEFDCMASLRMTYSAYQDSNGKSAGIPFSMLPEVLDSSRFMVPPQKDMLIMLQKFDQDYNPNTRVKWDLLEKLAIQLEPRETCYPAMYYQSASVPRASSSSPNGWRCHQRGPTRRTHPEDIYDDVEPQVLDLMKELEESRKKFLEESNYLEADAATQRLLELKIIEDNKRRAAILERHLAEREQTEKAYQLELKERNKLWDDRVQSFQDKVVGDTQRLKQQHARSLEIFKSKMASKLPTKPQVSREVLHQRKIQSLLGKQRKYLEAEEVKKSADKMEQAKMQETIAAFQSEVAAKEQALLSRQQTETDILLQRAARTRDEIRMAREVDLQQCHQRHKNVIRELMALQRQECLRFDQLMQKKLQHYKASGGNILKLSQATGLSCLPSMMDPCVEEGCS